MQMGKSAGSITLALVVGCWAALFRPQSAAAERHLVVGWNERGGGLSFIRAVSADQPWSYVSEPLRVGRDPVMRFANERLYVLNSEDDTIRIVDPRGWAVERDMKLGTAGAPADIAVVGPTTAYVTLRDSASVLRLDLTSGQARQVLDLGTLAPAGAVPELGTMAAHDGRLFVQVRRLDRDQAPTPAYVAVMDLATETLIDVDPARPGTQAIELAGTAPKGKMQVMPQSRRLWVNAGGGFFDAGGIEAVDLDALRSAGLAVREADGETGADLNAFVMLDATQGYLTYSTDLLASSHLHHFTADGRVDPTELEVSLDYITPAIEFDPRTNWVFLPTGGFGEDGIHIFDAATGLKLTGLPIATGGPPTDVVLIPEPGGWALVVTAGMGLLTARRRPRRHCFLAGMRAPMSFNH